MCMIQALNARGLFAFSTFTNYKPYGSHGLVLAHLSHSIVGLELLVYGSTVLMCGKCWLSACASFPLNCGVGASSVWFHGSNVRKVLA